MSAVEHFPKIKKIEYKGPSSKEPLSFRHYNAEEILAGKPMREWLRFSVCYWHTFAGAAGRDPFGMPTYGRPWEDETLDAVEMAKKRIDVAFEFFTKLGVEYYTFHDFDVAPEIFNNLQGSVQRLEQVSDYLLKKQEETGVQLLWATQNLFSHPRYMNGAMTNPEMHVFCQAASQIRAALDVGHKLGAANHVFWGGREGYQSLLNTDVKQECDQAAAMFKMVAKYCKEMGYKQQLLIEPKPREPTKHQYDYDAATTMAFLHQYGLSEQYKLNIEPNHTTLAGHAPEHDVVVAAAYGMLGSIDSNTGDTLLGWDTDQFPTNVQDTAAIMSCLLKTGGFVTGGLNFDCKVRRESVDPVDLFFGHVGAMDCYALGLRKAVQMMEAKELDNMLRERYLSWTSDKEALAGKILRGEATLQECADYAAAKGESEPRSGKQELFEMVRNRYLYSGN